MRAAVPALHRVRAMMAHRKNADRAHVDDVLRALRKSGVAILSQRNNGRRMVLVIDQPPAFVRGVRRGWHRTPAGEHACTMAAPFRGVQLEWTVAETPAEEVGHG